MTAKRCPYGSKHAQILAFMEDASSAFQEALVSKCIFDADSISKSKDQAREIH